MNKLFNRANQSRLAGGRRPPGGRCQNRRCQKMSHAPLTVRVAVRLGMFEWQLPYVVLANLFIFSIPLYAADWPLIRGDAAATGAVAEALPHNLDILWTYQAKGSGIDATASIAAGVVYVGDADGTFHAVKLDDGKPVWTRKFEQSGFVAGSAVADGRVFCVDMNGMVRCLNAADGATIWEFPTETSLYAAPNVHEGLVLIAAESGQLFGLDAATGKKKWEPFTIDQPLRCWPTVVQGHALVAGCDGKMHLVDVATGKGAQEIDIGGPADGMPAVLGDKVYFCTAAGVFHALTINPLSNVWHYEHKGQGETIHAAAVNDKAVILGTHDKRIVALDPATGEQKWSFTLRARAESSPVIVGDVAFAATIRGRLHALDMNTGHELWQTDVGGRFSASPAVSDGRIVVGNEDGTLYCLGAKK
jgi:outer membrane protein assembly factor BamB